MNNVDFPLSRGDYWKYISITLVVLVILGATLPMSVLDDMQSFLAVGGGFLTIYLSTRRCADIGWHPAWGILGYSILGIIVFGIPRGKANEVADLELES